MKISTILRSGACFLAKQLPDQLQERRSFQKKLLSIATLMLAALMFSFTANAQLSGIKTIPGDYSTVAAAVTDLNAQGVGAGGVTFNVAAGHSETLTGKITLTATGTAANPIIFQKSGAGANPVLNAYVGTVGTPSVIADGFFVLAGSDYVTIDGINLQESAANTTTTTVMEFGYGLFKASATDGSQNNVIKNCTITLNRLQNTAWTAPGHNGSTGIAILNGLHTATGAVTVTAASGANSNNQIYSNTIQNCNAGIVLVGFGDVSPFALGDTNNDIGGNSAATGNSILNFGGAAAATNPATGIFVNQQWGLNCSYNTINNNNGSGVNHVSTLRGIFLNSSSTSASADCNFNNITIKGGGTTSQVTGIENVFGSTAAGNTININNNTITGDYLTATTGTFYGIWSSSTPATLNMNNNTVTNIIYSALANTGTGVNYLIYNSGAATNVNANGNTVSNYSRFGTTGGTTAGIYFSSGTNQTANNNTINNISIDGTGTASTMYGIWTTTGTIVVNNNSISNLSCLKTTGTSIMYGIYNGLSPTNENYNFNTVNNLTHNGTGITYGIYTFTTTGTRTMSNNVVHTITTGGTTVAGINNASSSPNVFNNKVYNITSTSTGTPTVSGIIQGSLGTSGVANIYNNLIGDIKAPNASGTALVRGINITTATATSSVNVSYNTVYLNASSSGANFGSAALYVTTSATATTANLTLRNNILVNASTASGTGFTVAYQRSTTALNNYNSASNNNLFHAGSPSATNLIFYDGTNSDQTLAAYKARVAPADAASVTENPAFLSTVGSSANFLHINPAIASQIESGGTPVTGITTDFDGNTRNATTPDIGGDEYAGIALDINPPTIVYTPLASSCTASIRTLTATITDPSGVPTSGPGLPVLYWSVNSAAGPFTPVTATSLGSNQYSFTLGNTTVGDAIHYYIVAQDNNTPTPNVGAFPSAGAGNYTANPPAAGTPPTTPSSYLNLGPFSGIKTVGVGGDYATLTAAVAAYNNSCVSGPVIFSLIDATYPSETFPIVINENPGASATNTLTIRPAAGVSPTITGSATPSIIRLNGADWVTIDGSNNGTTTRDLTISNTNTGTATATIWLNSVNSTNGATNNTIKNCIVSGNAPATTLGAIVSSGTTMGGVAEAANSNNTYQNNALSTSQFGIAIVGPTGNESNNVITNNTIGSATAANKLGRAGIGIFQQQNVNVANNTIFGVSRSSADNIGTGISVNGTISGGSINANNISDIRNTNTSGYGASGLYLASSTASTGITISNNFIYDVAGYGWGSNWTDNGHGIYINTGGGYNIYYNSVNLATDQTVAGNSAAIYIASTIAGLNIRNNVLVNAQTTGTRYAVYTAGTATAFTAINYNDYVAPSGIGFLTSARVTLADWQAATGQDVNSISQNPVFISNTDLHVNPAGTPVESAGTPIAGITTDYDGNTRNASTPDIGGDEGNFVLLDLTGPAIVYTNIPNSICTSPATLSATITDASGINTASNTKPRIWFKKSTEANVLPASNTSADSGWKFVEASNASSPFSFTLNYNLLTSAVNSGDIIEYFVVAQDLATTPNVGTNAATYTAAPTSVALSAGVFPVSGVKSFTILASPTSVATVATPNTLCVSGNVNLSLSGDPATGAQYQWQSSPAGANNWTNISGATASTYAAIGVTASTDYRCVITCGGTPIPASPSSVATVTVNNPQVLTTTPGTECGPGPVSVTLGATANAGSTLNWYAAASGGMAIGTGTSFNTPPISSTTTYYVSANQGGGLSTIPGDGGWNHVTTTGGFQTTLITGAYMILTVTQPLTLSTMDIYPSATLGTAFTIEARTGSASGTTFATYSGNTTVVNSGTPTVAQTVPVNWVLPAGTYYIGFVTTNPSTWRSGVATHTFPWVLPGVVSMDFYLTPSYQYYFYNLMVTTGCESARTPVVATIQQPTNTYYQDADGDSYGNPSVSVLGCTAPSGYVSNNTDCNDGNNAINPGATEICDGIDNNCNGQTDEGLLLTFYQDSDGDGFGNPAASTQACSAPSGYVSNNTDCNDGNNAINPGATEICDGIDNNCNGQTDEGLLLTFYQDSDGDSFGNPAVSTQACSAPAGYVSNNTDCNDGNAAIKPGATEICDGIDNNCNGQTDEGLLLTFYQDSDGDGFGNPAASTQACSVPAGYVSNNTDCNDGNAAINPNTVWYKDSDNDGYSDGTTLTQCVQPAGYKLAGNLTALSGDCNDNIGSINPGAMEVCNGIDDNCNGQVDEGALPVTWYRDFDGDGYGNAAITTVACTPPAGYVGNNTDCNDNNAAINPGATEICDGIDNNCNGQTDEGVLLTFYRDFDGDGYGNAAVTATGCSAPTGYVANSLDCNDNNAAINPAATEICDGIDNNCNGQTDEGVLLTFYRDFDGDGYGNAAVTATGCSAPTGYVANSLDCNDNNAAINPAATEICDGIDNNCNGQTDEGLLLTFYQDSDGDGYGNPAVSTQACSAPGGYVANNTDCNDGNSAVNPGASEICDGIDNNCDGFTDNFVNGITLSNISQCDANGTVDPTDDTFTANATVTFGTIPAAGFLNLTGDGAASVAVGSLSGNSHTFTNVTMSADGTTISLTAEFSAATGCGFTNSNAGTAPSNCSGTCFVDITNIVTTPEGCAGSSSGTITVYAAASAGQLGYSNNGGASFQLQNVFSNVPAGTYNIVVIVYGGGCSTSGVAVVGGPTGQVQTWYKDIDGDGYSDGVTLQSCASPGTGWYLAAQLTATSGDCNDYDANQHPGQTWYKDADNDGYSDGTTLVQCSQPVGYKIAANLISAAIDCNDSNAAVHPGAVEVCNGIDDNCNGQIDEGLSDLTYNGNVTFTSQAQVNAWNLCYTIINGNLTIKNTSIDDITRLINLRKVTGFVSIENTHLDSLVGLINLDTIGGNMTIKQNSKLETLSGIDSLKRVSGSLAIFFNLKLTDCCPIYSLLLNPNGVGGSVSIYANKTGCDSVPQVLAECDPSSPIIAPSGGQYGNVSNKEALQQRVDLFPNPASEEVTIMIQKEFNSGALKFYDLQGRLLMKAELDANTFQHRIKLGDLPQGAYLVQVLLDGGQFVQKLVIE